MTNGFEDLPFPFDPATVGRELNRYFTGKHMTAEDFEADQHYFLSRHRLHNALLHGWGVVWGLEVRTVVEAGKAVAATDS